MATTNSDVDFIISSVEMKPGKTRRYLHDHVEGKPCYIGDAEPRQRGFIWYYDDDEAKWTYVHTSVIQSVKRTENDAEVDIVTENTIYHLLRTNYNEDTYRGVVEYTILDAKLDVQDFCKEHDIQPKEKFLIEATEFLYKNMKERIWPHDREAYMRFFCGLE